MGLIQDGKIQQANLEGEIESLKTKLTERTKLMALRENMINQNWETEFKTLKKELEQMLHQIKTQESNFEIKLRNKELEYDTKALKLLNEIKYKESELKEIKSTLTTRLNEISIENHTLKDKLQKSSHFFHETLGMKEVQLMAIKQNINSTPNVTKDTELEQTPVKQRREHTPLPQRGKTIENKGGENKKTTQNQPKNHTYSTIIKKNIHAQKTLETQQEKGLGITLTSTHKNWSQLDIRRALLTEIKVHGINRDNFKIQDTTKREDKQYIRIRDTQTLQQFRDLIKASPVLLEYREETQDTPQLNNTPKPQTNTKNAPRKKPQIKIAKVLNGIFHEEIISSFVEQYQLERGSIKIVHSFQTEGPSNTT
ncbi:uncharacterized protein LOC129232878 [Uloborus diversus]|uniref:uncharacterized protein LOC129232878 n=1 Tax=Uloborus diversus TaxID=327109 RepID=UPI0024090CD5|nr:uncharacterized protein LOC129232878 [Uloborus diversus]